LLYQEPPETASPRSSRPGSCAGRRAPPGRRSVTRCSAPSRDHDSCRNMHHFPPHRCPPRLKRPPPLLDPIRRLSCRRAATFSRSGIAERLSRRATIAEPATQALPSLIALSRSLAAFTGRTIRSTPVRGLRKCPWRFGPIFKASMVGFTLLSRSYYYLRRRSPAPPFPPDRQAGKRGAIRYDNCVASRVV